MRIHKKREKSLLVYLMNQQLELEESRKSDQKNFAILQMQMQWTPK